MLVSCLAGWLLGGLLCTGNAAHRHQLSAACDMRACWQMASVSRHKLPLTEVVQVYLKRVASKRMQGPELTCLASPTRCLRLKQPVECCCNACSVQ